MSGHNFIAPTFPKLKMAAASEQGSIWRSRVEPIVQPDVQPDVQPVQPDAQPMTTVRTEHMRRAYRHIMLLGDYTRVGIKVKPWREFGVVSYIQPTHVTAKIEHWLDDDFARELKIPLQGSYPAEGYIQELAEAVFRLKICPCGMNVCPMTDTCCGLCMLSVMVSDTRSCVVCTEVCHRVGKKCMVCADGIVCRDCHEQSEDRSACPVCKSKYPRFLNYRKRNINHLFFD